MSAREQSIHLHLGDQYTAGLRPTAEAAPYNVNDTIRPSWRWLTGGTQDSAFNLPVPIVANEWSLEHLLGPIMDTVTLNFVPTVGHANVKVGITDAAPQQLGTNGAIRAQVDNAMSRVAVEPMFANLAPEVLFLLNGAASFNGNPAVVVAHGIRPGSRFETEGFTIQIDPTFASSGARSDLVVQLDASNEVRFMLSGGGSILRVTAGAANDDTPIFSHASGANMHLVVDWLRLQATVVLASTGQELATVALTNGNWGGLETTDATFGVFDGDVYAPQARPLYADPRVDLIIVQMGAEVGLGSAAAEATLFVDAVNQMRNEAWGARALVWFLVPKEDVPTSGTPLAARTGVVQAVAELENTMAFETRGLERSVVGGDEVITGAGLIVLANSMERDWLGVVNSNLRVLARPPHTGYRRFQKSGEANAFIDELIEAGLTTREVSPHLGGNGTRSGDGVDGPWNLARTTRKDGDYDVDANTGELLVPIDLAAAQAGFPAPQL